MRFTIDQRKLVAAIQATLPVTTDQYIPILNTILILTRENEIAVVGTDLEVAVVVRVPARIIEKGGVTLKAHDFYEIVQNCEEEIEFSTGKDLAILSSGRSKSRLKDSGISNFPKFPLPLEYDIQVEAGTFRTAIHQSVYAAAKTDTRPILQGIHFTQHGTSMYIDAADNYRMTTDCIEVMSTGNSEVVVPTRSVQLAARFCEDTETLLIHFTDRHAYFKTEKVTVISQLLEGEYPDIQSLIPHTFLTEVEVYREQLILSLRRADIFAKDDSHRFKLVINNHQVDVISGRSERGDLEDSVGTELQGDELEVGVSIKYMLDALKSFDSEMVILSANGPRGSIVLRQPERSVIALISPMDLRS